MSIYDLTCPNCRATCWVNNGDTDDLTVPDIECVTCWKCDHVFAVDEYVYQDKVRPEWAEMTYATADEAAKG